MLVPLSWLKEYVDIDMTPAELADRLVSCGFEIESVIDLNKDTENVVTAKVLSIEKHPNADKLSVCALDIGNKKIQVVTAAQNLSVGNIIPVALDNSRLPSGKTITAGELRGVKSDGMMVSGAELDLTESDYKGASANGILILDGKTRIGEDINKILGRDEIVLDIGITANRQDANSIYGIAIETAAATGAKLKPLDLNYTAENKGITKLLSLENRAEDLCPRYIAGVSKGIKIAESPEIIKKRLRAVGIRPVNNIVDITNYVLIEVGQPMHAFDITAIKGGKITVRRASENEKITALDDKEYTLNGDMLVIANEKEPMAIAGVMGGAVCSIFDTTETVVFESARFKRDSVRKTARALNLHSDSSKRFEKGVDYPSQDVGMKRAFALIEHYGLGKIYADTLDSFPNKPEQKVFEFTSDDISRILGITIPEKRIIEILNSLNMKTTLKNGKFSTEIPLNREDMYGINDIAEELIRIYGYDNITLTLPGGNTLRGGKSLAQTTADKIKNILTAKGCYEILTYSFVSPSVFDSLCLPKDSALRTAVRLRNPLGEDFSVMRTTLAGSMLKTLVSNLQKGNKSGRFFEIAKTYIPKELPLKDYPVEKNKLAIGSLDDDFYTFKELITSLLDVLHIEYSCKKACIPYLHTGRTAVIISEDGAEIGYFGEVSDDTAENYDTDKRLYVAELDAEYLIASAKKTLPFKVIPKYPAVERDLALVTETGKEADGILSVIRLSGGKNLLSSEIFDVYSGGQIEKGYKSVAVRLVFRSAQGTLTDSEVNADIENILNALEKTGVKLR